MQSSLLCAAAVLSACVLVSTEAFAKEDVSPQEVLRRADPSPMRMGNLPVRTVLAGEEDRTLAPYFHVAGAKGADDRQVETLPLEETTAEVSVAGVIAQVRLRQVFKNDGKTPIEAVYVFPASTRAAIHDLKMKIGSRTIEGQIQKRAEAQQTYEAAKSEGRRAALLSQERPNVFTTKVANVMPKDRIEVELTYSELLVPEDGIYEVVVPGVVGPRYPGGANPSSDRWIASPYLTEGQKEPWRFDVRARLETGLSLRDLSSPSHKVKVAWEGARVAEVTLDEPGGGNRDFILRYRLADEQIEAGALAYRSPEGKGGYFSVIVAPPNAPKPEQIAPREYIFVVDISGSMGGFPLDVSKTLMRDLLGGVRATDHFNVVLFASGQAVFSPKSLPATASNIRRGVDFVNGRNAGGGTELLGALRAAYGLPRTGKHVARTVVLVTDGYVAVEGEAFRFVRERLGEANFFSFGIGSSVNRALIEGLARAGNGEPWVLTNAATAQAQAAKFRRAIEAPVLTDISVRFGDGFEARDVAPMKLPDLMARRPLVLYGRFNGAPSGRIEMSGNVGGKRWTQTVSLDAAAEAAPRREALRYLWARKWVELLEDQHHLTGASEVEDAITGLGLSHRLVTPFTSFVAVDSEVANKSGAVHPVNQPLPLPQGVSNNAIGAQGMLGAYGTGGMYGGGESYGLGGLGLRGTGPGGGGAGLGAGGVGTRGRGAGGYGEGEGTDRKKDAPVRDARVIEGKVQTQGALNKDLIRQVVRRHRAQLRYCYESQLSRDPSITGKLVLHFTIDAKGNVTRVELVESSLGDENVEKCVMGRVRTWRFPEPKGGGTVTVTYPWTFRPPAG